VAKPDSEHELMVKALAERLARLYPDCVALTLGKVVKSVGLKPDIYIEHSDGRKWAFEMVHKNVDSEKIRRNHERYQSAGISDTWILWQSLEPKSGPHIPLAQGQFPIDVPKWYELNMPQKTLLSLQPEGNRFLFAFDIGTAEEREMIGPNPLIQAQWTGIIIYDFSDWDGGEACVVRDKDFVTIPMLEFSPTGQPMSSQVPEMGLALLLALGIDTSASSQAELLGQLRMMSVSNLLPFLLKQLPLIVGEPFAKEQHDAFDLETESFLKLLGSGVIVFPDIAVDAVDKNPDAMEQVAQLQAQLDSYLKPFPLIRQYLFNASPQLFQSQADMMRLQAEDEDYRNAAQNT